MKKSIFNFFALIFSVSVICLFAGCSQILDVLFSSEPEVFYQIPITYDSKTPYYIIDMNAKTEDDKNYRKQVTFSGLPANKELYYVSVNKGNSTFRGAGIAALSSNTAADPVTAEALSAEKTEAAEILKAAETADFHYSAPVINPPADMKMTSVSRAAADPETELEIGAVKKIWCDNDVNVTTFEQKNATLRAKGKYCYVWVVNEYYKSGDAENARINKSIAENFVSKFDEIYPLIRNVYGNEANLIANYDSNKYESMSTFSDTGTKINIVVYDIGKDYESEKKCNILGYFYSKDYFYSSKILKTNVDYSNAGKYFYVDSAYAVADINQTISTLAHEFQHMINYSVKNLSNKLKPSSAYNEMLSMLCEDMMQEKLGLNDDNSIKVRVSSFNVYYYLSGLYEWRNDSYTTFSYANNYVFGAWLCRNFGGAALVKEMMSNSKIDNDSIVSAVNKLKGTKYTYSDLIGLFLAGILDESTWTLNKNAETSITYNESGMTYSYPMTAINMRKPSYSIKNTANESNMSSVLNKNYDCYGPVVFKDNTDTLTFNKESLLLRPYYGFMLKYAGKARNGTEYIFDSSDKSKNQNEVVYLIVK